MDIQDYLDFRRDKDEFFMSDHHLPLGHGDHSDFADGA